MSKKSSFSKLVNSEQNVFIDFHATWCGPCKMMNPIVSQIAKERGESMKIVKIDIDKNQKLAENLEIRGVPTFMLFKNGKSVWRKSGAMTKHDLEKVLDQHEITR
jgi:thioredoxin 1